MFFSSFRTKNKVKSLAIGGASRSSSYGGGIHKVASGGSLTSMASTLSSDSTSTKPQQEDFFDDTTSIADSVTTGGAGASIRRRVTFSEDLNIHHRDTKADFDCSITWYSEDEYAQFKRDMKATVDQALDEQKGNNEARKAFYKFVRGLHSSSKQFQKLVRNADDLLTPRQLRYLSQLYAVDEKRLDLIGLEYQVIPGLKKETKQVRERIQDATTRVQMECRKGWFKPNELDEELRFACLQLTLAPVMFAQMLAKAQSLAA
uniref:Uncharacterized protein n=1 Tax=Entomoneis paludosa TaxID=265537 RepID=A0A7S2YQI4_9STRA|mmetsp:Transcript_5888/g.12402  ORF Transcript_5888/g.12402 Transcript_5888/m.12402 type:complete len:261 (+) Transcript_5888:281-1063(+)|eukprot:CAMPEP_0172451478 /NCGR_PEP_ID=MMETSP1065-20121228/9517_1 /TAXON_ID=265537 /ORGANISM="Amphiprora paludosa, Strain CCMP125" /LENGTH=260 /DNA_ID=CAMNT_0013203441 /DNA_START=285 /DNA_END=1067 /DNA_ORIENTATION=-